MLHCCWSSKSFRNEPYLTFRLVNKKLRDETQFAQSLQVMNTGKLVIKVTVVTKFHLFSNQGNSGNKSKRDNKDNVSNQNGH